MKRSEALVLARNIQRRLILAEARVDALPDSSERTAAQAALSTLHDTLANLGQTAMDHYESDDFETFSGGTNKPPAEEEPGTP